MPISLPDLAIWLVAAAIALIGAAGLVQPMALLRAGLVGANEQTLLDEVRVRIGGGGLAMAVMLAGAIHVEGLRAGICIALGSLLLGFGLARAGNAIVQRGIARTQAIWLGLELLAGALLYWAA